MLRAELQKLATSLRIRWEAGGSGTVFLGAGCSVSARIPAADRMIEEIRERDPSVSETASYTEAMAALTEGSRRDLIARMVRDATVNLCYRSVAQLLKWKVFNRVFTTNFDPVLEWACAEKSVRVVALDMTLPSQHWPQYSNECPIYYLHGRHVGGVLINTATETIRNEEALKRDAGHLFRNAGRVGPWAVCGYSGRNDPILGLIAETRNYESGMFWSIHPDTTLAEEVVKKMRDVQNMFILEGYDADRFFAELVTLCGAWAGRDEDDVEGPGREPRTPEGPTIHPALTAESRRRLGNLGRRRR